MVDRAHANWGLTAAMSAGAAALQVANWASETETLPTALRVAHLLAFLAASIGLAGSLVMLAKGGAPQG